MTTKHDNYDLSSHNTFRVKASCRLFIEYDSVEDLMELDFKSLPQPVMSIGSGSNLLLTKDYEGTMLHGTIRFIEETQSGNDDCLVDVGAGVIFDDFVKWCCERNLWGAENLSLIPGETGSAAVQNIGAYGVEIQDIVERVNCFDAKERCIVSIGRNSCEYGYRDSVFKQGDEKKRYIVTSVIFRLSKNPAPKLEYGGLRVLAEKDNLSPETIREAVISVRRSKLPDPEETGSAGSFFKNPVVSREKFDTIVAAEGGEIPHFEVEGGIKIPAAWMIEKSGLKGCRCGGAAVYEKQPLVIVNADGKATPGEILNLEKIIIEKVEKRFGVTLHPEVEHI